MSEKQTQQKPEPKRKLTLTRQTLRALDDSQTRVLDNVVGGTYTPGTCTSEWCPQQW